MLKYLVLFFLIIGCENPTEEWIGFVYPDRTNLENHLVVGPFTYFGACQTASRNRISQLVLDGVVEHPTDSDYECGLNCKLHAEGVAVCEETLK